MIKTSPDFFSHRITVTARLRFRRRLAEDYVPPGPRSGAVPRVANPIYPARRREPGVQIPFPAIQLTRRPPKPGPGEFRRVRALLSSLAPRSRVRGSGIVPGAAASKAEQGLGRSGPGHSVLKRVKIKPPIGTQVLVRFLLPGFYFGYLFLTLGF